MNKFKVVYWAFRIVSIVALVGYVVVIDGFWQMVAGAFLIAVALTSDEIADEAKKGMT